MAFPVVGRICCALGQAVSQSGKTWGTGPRNSCTDSPSASRLWGESGPTDSYRGGEPVNCQDDPAPPTGDPCT